MGLNCGCPVAASLHGLTIPECKESLGQIQKVLFQRIFKAEATKNRISLEDIKKKTSMAALLSATDSSKLIVSPYIQNPTTTPGEARTFGGGNQTLGGIEIVIGREPTTFEGVIYQESQSVIKTLKTYSCENIGVYLIDEHGNIAGFSPSDTTDILPIPIDKFFVGDKNLGGYEEPDSNTISWNFQANWSDDLVIVKYGFGDDGGFDYYPLLDLANAN